VRNLFDTRPKSSRGELYDREDELKFLDRVVDRPLIVVLGIRRIGKTSLLKAFLEPYNGIYIDLRGAGTHIELYERLSEGISSGLGKLRRFLEGIRGISIMGVSVSIKWRGQDSISLLGLLEELNRRGRFIVVFDEAQEVRPVLSAELRRVIAYSYDNLGNITIVLSGSQIGLMENFMGLGNVNSPLFGRYAVRLVVPRFTSDQSREFLSIGFREAGVQPPAYVLEEAVAFFDGIPGWLVHFGRSYVDGIMDMGEIKGRAVSIAMSELSRLSRKERAVLKAIANGAVTWGSARRLAEEYLGETIPKSTLTRIVNKLEALSIIKDYKFLDNVYMEAAKQLKLT
jgi:Predicted ATPase (AAA+ superfamily)